MRHSIGILLAILSALVLTGCGGGGAASNPSAPASGRAVIVIQWPEPSRLIPAAANSISIQVQEGSTAVDQQLAARPASGNTSTVSFNNLPSGSFTVQATAYPNADGTGTALSAGSVPLTLGVGETKNFTVTMTSTIDHLELSAPVAQIVSGATTPFTVTAKDVSGALVLTTPGKLQWSSGTPSVAAVDSSGVVTGALAGTSAISVTDSESGKSVSKNITVLLIVTALPNSPTLTLSQMQTFTATIVGSANTGVTWSVQEGSAGGSITPAGVYTAPLSPGIYHVIATSQADPTRKDTATITVQSGSASGTIQ